VGAIRSIGGSTTDHRCRRPRRVRVRHSATDGPPPPGGRTLGADPGSPHGCGQRRV